MFDTTGAAVARQARERNPAMLLRTIFVFSIIATCSLGAVLLSAAKPPVDSPSRGLLLVVNANDELGRKGEGYIAFFDPETGQQIAKVNEGGITAHEVAVSPDGRFAYAPIYSNANLGQPGTDGSTIAVIDIAARKVVDSIDFGRGMRPHFAVWSPADNLLYVTTEVDNSVGIVDPQTRKVIGSIPTGAAASHNVAISHDGRRGYTSNVLAGTVSVLDLKTRKNIASIPISVDGTPIHPERKWKVQRISVSADDRTVFTSDWTKPEVVAIDAATNTVKARVPVPSPGYGTVSTSDGRWLLVASADASKVAVVDLKTMTLAHSIDVPPTPQEIVLRPDEQYAYVTCDQARKVAVIRLSDWTVVKLMNTGNYPDGMAWVPSK
jgi:YVTN family beta-propeller protein